MERKTETKDMAGRLAMYGMAAASAAAVGMAGTASADLVTVPVSINSSGSLEAFLDVGVITLGASTFTVGVSYNAFSAANPLAPYSDLMMRGAGAFSQLRATNGGGLANTAGSLSGVPNVVNVGAAFVLPGGGAGTYLIASNIPAGIMAAYTSFTYGQFGPGGGVVYFQLHNNEGDGNFYDAWATVDTSVPGSPTITAVHVDTGIVPAPGPMALLCLGAAGLGRYRRIRKK